MEERVRPEALRGLTVLAINDRQFRDEAIENLEGTLERYGYALNDAEMREVRDFHARVSGASDDDIVQELDAGQSDIPNIELR